ncbi:MAG: alginate export family protein [Verrucomicrobiota bacterium]
MSSRIRAMTVLAFVLVAVLLVSGAMAGEKTVPKTDKPAKAEKPAKVEKAKAGKSGAACPMSQFVKDMNLRGGLDIRIREEYFDDIPIIADPPGVTRGGENDYFRFRTRAWMEADPMKNVTFKARLVNEFRLWAKPSGSVRSPTQAGSYDPEDEFVFDNLYLDIKGLANDKLDLRIGRQELIYGTGKVILEGTPKDGSRTIYFDAVKATLKTCPDSTLDIIGIYNPPEDDLAINSADRELTGFTSAYNDETESGGGLYFKSQKSKEMPFEAYLLYKNESEWQQPAKKDAATGAFIPPALPWQRLDEAEGEIVTDDSDIGTVGTRLLPVFSERLSGNIELAFQFGQRGDEDLQAYMADAFLIYKLPMMEDMKPAVDYGLYYLSGDDATTAKDEGWDPLWSRWPQYSELYVYAWDAEGAAKWQNVSMPHVGLTLSPTKWLKTSALVGYMWAPEANGPGGGDERGLLAVVKGEFTIKARWVPEKHKLAGHLWLEMVDPGNYYQVDDTAVFARWQLTYEF